MDEMCDDKQVVYRLGQVENQVDEIGGDVKLIMTNHLPHIEKEISKSGVKMTEKITSLDLKTTKQIASLQSKMNWIGGGMGAGIIIAIIIQFLT
jgi:hypothetical protein